MAWEAFGAAIAEAQALHASGADVAAIQDLLQHARELLDIIEDEIALNGWSLPEWAQGRLGYLRTHLPAVESALMTRH